MREIYDLTEDVFSHSVMMSVRELFSRLMDLNSFFDRKTFYCLPNPLSDEKFLDWSKLEEIADDI